MATLPIQQFFDKVGMFDEELVRNQDDEFIQRMIEAGAKQYMSQKNLASLWLWMI